MDDEAGELEDLLIVDDNPGDIRFIEEAVTLSQFDPTIHTVTTEEKALDFVYRRADFDDAPIPDVVFLDWNLSKTTGKEVLEAIRTIDTSVSVVVMTGSQPAKTAEETSGSQAEMYIEKPTDPDGYIQCLRSI